MPVADPARVFDWPEYRETGAVFWPDIVAVRKGFDIVGLRDGLAGVVRTVRVRQRRPWMCLSLRFRLVPAALLRSLLGSGDPGEELLFVPTRGPHRVGAEQWCQVGGLGFTRDDRTIEGAVKVQQSFNFGHVPHLSSTSAAAGVLRVRYRSSRL